MKRSARFLIPLLLAVAALSPVLVVPEVAGIDETVRVRVADAIVERGELAIPFWSGHDDEIINVYYNRERNRYYGLWNIGQSLVLVPFVAAGNLAARLGEGPLEKSLLRGAVICIGYTLVINVLLAWVTFGVLRQLGQRRRIAALGVLVLLFCTQWLVWGMTLQEEGLSALLLLAALWAGLRCTREAPGMKTWLWAVAAGACLGFLANVRVNAAFAAAAVLLWPAWVMPNRKQALAFMGGAVLAALPFFALLLWYNFARTGDALASPYTLNMKQMGVEYRFTLARFWSVLFGYDNGALWFALPLLLLPALRARGIDSRRLWGGSLIMLAAFLAHAAALSGFYARVGVWGAGSPRLLAHNIIVLGPLVWMAARRLALWPRRRASLRWAVPLLAAVFGLSFSAQVLARALNPELESSQDVFYELSGHTPPLPAMYVPRRVKNFRLALEGKLTEFTYPAGFVTSNNEIPRNAANEARHTMLVLPPAYFVHVEKFSGPISPRAATLAWAGWWCALALCGASQLWLIFRLRRPRPSHPPQTG